MSTCPVGKWRSEVQAMCAQEYRFCLEEAKTVSKKIVSVINKRGTKTHPWTFAISKE